MFLLPCRSRIHEAWGLRFWYVGQLMIAELFLPHAVWRSRLGVLRHGFKPEVVLEYGTSAFQGSAHGLLWVGRVEWLLAAGGRRCAFTEAGGYQCESG